MNPAIFNGSFDVFWFMGKAWMEGDLNDNYEQIEEDEVVNQVQKYSRLYKRKFHPIKFDLNLNRHVLDKTVPFILVEEEWTGYMEWTDYEWDLNTLYECSYNGDELEWEHGELPDGVIDTFPNDTFPDDL